MNIAQVSSKHKKVGVPVTDAVANLYPDAPRVDIGGVPHIVLPHLPTETFMLRQLGFDVPAPIVAHYEWPHPPGKPPFDVQKKTCAMLTMSTRAYVLNGMGTGKTACALWSWDYLRTHNLAGKMLVDAPLSTLSFTWAREVFGVLPHRKYAVLHGTRAQRLARLADPDVEIFIVNHDGIKTINEALEARADIDTLVIDELAAYRNGGTARSKAMGKMAKRFRWVWGMTGEPIPNCPTDVWAQAKIITPDRVPKYYGAFRKDLMHQLAPFRWVPKTDSIDKAFAALQPAVRYTLEDVTELPEFIERTVDIEMGPQQKKIYKQLVDHCHAAVKSGEITAVNAGVVMSKLLQVSLGWVYTKDGTTASLDNEQRLDALIDSVNGSNRKVLVFVPFKHALAGISQALTKEGIEHAVVSGDTPASERSQVFNLFQNTDKYKVIAAHPQCLAHGITLTAADTVIWFGPVTSLEIFNQANARIRRVGQQHKQLYLKFCATPVEKKIYAMLDGKQNVQARLLELFEEAST